MGSKHRCIFRIEEVAAAYKNSQNSSSYRMGDSARRFSQKKTATTVTVSTTRLTFESFKRQTSWLRRRRTHLSKGSNLSCRKEYGQTDIMTLDPYRTPCHCSLSATNFTFESIHRCLLIPAAVRTEPDAGNIWKIRYKCVTLNVRHHIW